MAAARGRLGALATLAAGFFLSAALRTGEVVAALPLGSAAAGGSSPATAEAEPAGGEDLVGLAADLARQREELARRAEALAEREALLAAIEQRVRARLAELEAAREKLRQTAALVDDAASRDVRRLARMYEAMKPKQAGRIFDTMAPEFAAGFLGEMDPSAAASILASMEPKRAYAVTVLLAGRNVGRAPGKAAAAAGERRAEGPATAAQPGSGAVQPSSTDSQ